MSRRRTLKGLMIAIAAIGIAIAVIVRPIELWVVFLPILHLTILLTAILACLYRNGLKRAYWSGFAVFGWAYFLTSMIRNYLMGQPPLLVPELHLWMGNVNWIKLTMSDLIKTWHSLMRETDDVGRLTINWSLGGLAFAGIGGIIARVLALSQSGSTGQDYPPQSRHQTDAQ